MFVTPSIDGPVRSLALCTIQRPPSELAAVRTREELRSVLRNDLVWKRARWIDAAGLRIGDQRGQTRLLRAVADFREGLAGLNENPHTAVLDLSTLRVVGVDALANLPVVCSTVVANGALLVICEPRHSVVATLLESSGLTGQLGGQWVAEGLTPWFQSGRSSGVPDLQLHAGAMRETSGRRALTGSRPAWTRRDEVERGAERRGTLHLLREVAVFDHPNTLTPSAERELRDLSSFTRDAVSSRVRDLRSSQILGSITKGILTEAASNTSEKSRAKRMAIALGVRDCDCPSLELAIADNGCGIAEAHLNTLPYVGRIPERVLVADVWQKAYTNLNAGLGPGRGIVLMVRRLLQESDARVWVRTGGVLLTITRRMHSFTVLAEASVGLGTTIHVSVPLDRAS